MIRTIFAALLGRAIDRGGMKGAIIGAVGQRALNRMGRFGWVIGELILLWSLTTGRRRRFNRLPALT